MNIWPINKIKSIFSSIDQQLKERAKSEERLQKGIDEIAEKQAELATELGNLEKQKIVLVGQQNEINEKTINLSNLLNEMQGNFDLHRTDKTNDHWMTRFGYDSLIANLQLATVELAVPGNRARLEALRDTHKGEKCFVIGNGPSLKAEDLTKLHDAGVFCFGSKRITAIFDETPWRPNVWGVSDLDFIGLYHDEMSELSGFPKLVPCQSILNLNIPIKDAIYFPFIQAERTPCWFNKDVTRGVHFWGTITCKLINFAVYMGFTEIYLLGVDNSYAVKKNANGKTIYDTAAHSNFSHKYYTTKEDLIAATKNVDDMDHTMEYLNNAYKDVEYFCNLFDVHVYNATRGGCLEAFPRVDFEELLTQR